MDSVFLSLLNVSITASWLVLAVLVLRFVLKKAPKWVFCLLWGIVAIRLVCPVSVESVLSLIPSTETVNITKYQTRPYIETGISAVDTPVNEYIGSTYFEGVTVPREHFASVTDMLGTLWFVGMLAMLIYCAASYIILRRRVATATILEDNIRQCETVGSPFVLGIFKPTIYLPYQVQPEDMAHVIAHEKAHIRRKDHWWKPIGFIILSVYWFNPVIWLAYIFLCRDIEAACDEKVIRDLETEERRAYSTALLNCSVHRRSIAACPLAFGEVGVKARVKNVMDYKKPAFWIILIAVIVCIAVAVCFLTDPMSDKSENVSADNHESAISEEIHAGAQSGRVSFSELEKIKDKLSAYMVEYKVATLDANEMTGMLDVQLYERVEGLEELIGQYLDLKYVKISMFEGELRFPVLYGDPYGQRKVEVTEITSDQRESGYRIEAYLPATDLSSVWETEQIKAHIERFRNMTAMEWAASSQLADVAYIDADTWAECEQQIGFRVQNPLEDASWLTHADSDGIPFDNGVDYIARHHVQITAHILRNISIRAGYLDGDVRIAFTATLQANNGNYSSGNIRSGYVTFESDSLKTASGAPVLVISPSTTGRYTSLSAYWLQGNVLYSVHLVDEQNRQAQLEKTLSKLLAEF